MMLMSVVYVLLGLLLIIFQNQSLRVICYLLGAACVIYGGVRLIIYFTNKNTGTESSFGFSMGVFDVVLGLVLMAMAEQIVVLFSVIIGIAIIADSIFKLQMAIELKRLDAAKWRNVMIGAGVMFVIGVILLFEPFKGQVFMAIMIGIALIADGALSILGIMAMDKLEKTTVNF